MLMYLRRKGFKPCSLQVFALNNHYYKFYTRCRLMSNDVRHISTSLKTRLHVFCLKRFLQGSLHFLSFGRYGAVDGFLTPNVADTRNPLVVVLHNGCVAAAAGGLTPDGHSEKFTVNLLSEEPDMPSASRMLEILAENPAAQAKFFIISMRLFLEHVLGVMPFDEQLRPNSTRASVVFPDGAAAEFLGGAFPAIQQLHGPIEEQARLACHPHIVLHFVNRASQAWLRRILLAQTTEAQELLHSWQTKTLLAVESIMSSCVGTVRLQFQPVPFSNDVDLQSQPYSSKWQEEDRFDGGLEEDFKDPEKRRTLVSVIPPVIDHHVRRRLAEEDTTSFEETKKKVNLKQLPLTGCVMARLPHYRLPVCGFSGCNCELCSKARDEFRQRSTLGGVESARSRYIDAFCQDLHEVCALSGHLHEHKNTCFKYAPEGSRRKPQHCRFHFTHFVKLWKEKIMDDRSTKVVEVIVARTGKEPLLPVWPQEGCHVTLNSLQGDLVLDGKHFAGRSSLGAVVESNQDGTQRGRIKTVQYNPREGQCFPVPGQEMRNFHVSLFSAE